MRTNAKFQVFISSTYKDLIAERQAAVETILQAGHIPAGMELFTAESRPQLEIIREWIDESDIFLLIVGGRYGSIDSESGLSYIELEYRHALDQGKPSFAVVLNEDWVNNKTRTMGAEAIERDNPEKWRTFQDFVKSRLVSFVGSDTDLRLATMRAINELPRKYDITGWVRADATTGSPQVAAEVARLSKENAALRATLAATQQQKQMTIDGRTVAEWTGILRTMRTSVPWKEGREPQQLDLASALKALGAAIADGVSSSDDRPMGKALYTIAAMLLSVGLAEHVKLPANYVYKRIRLSKSGIALVRELHALGAPLDAARQAAGAPPTDKAAEPRVPARRAQPDAGATGKPTRARKSRPRPSTE